MKSLTKPLVETPDEPVIEDGDIFEHDQIADESGEKLEALAGERDSLEVPQSDVEVDPDSTIQPPEEPVDGVDSEGNPPLPEIGPTIESSADILDLYEVIVALYPETEYAVAAEERRSELARGLIAIQQPEAEESGPDDGQQDDGPSLPQSIIDSAPPGTFSLRGTEPFDQAIGGFSWRVAAVPSPLAAQALMRNFVEEGYRTSATIEESARGQVYVLLLGQFASEAEAEASRNDLPRTGVGRNIEIIRIEDLVLMSAADLGNLGDD